MISMSCSASRSSVLNRSSLSAGRPTAAPGLPTRADGSGVPGVTPGSHGEAMPGAMVSLPTRADGSGALGVTPGSHGEAVPAATARLPARADGSGGSWGVASTGQHYGLTHTSGFGARASGQFMIWVHRPRHLRVLNPDQKVGQVAGGSAS